MSDYSTLNKYKITLLDKAVVALAVLVAAYAGVAEQPLIAIGVPALLGFVAVGCSARVHPGARIVAWLGVGFSVQLIISIPPIWPLAQLVWGLPALIAAFVLSPLEDIRTWLVRGELRWWHVGVMGGVSVLALNLWVLLFRPDLSRFTSTIPDVSWPLLFLGFAVFSVFNALIEEVIFRALLQGALSWLMRPGLVPILLQALLFGTCHYHGFPSGLIGVLLAGTWALMLGWSRNRTKGLLTPLLAHIAADASIFSLIVWQG